MKKPLTLGLIITAVVVLAVGAFRTASTIQHQDPPRTEQLKWHARQAKNAGRQKVQISSGITDYAGSSSSTDLEHALGSSTVVIARLVEKRTYQLNSNSLVTWNKFRTDEVLSEAKSIPCPRCGDTELPNDLLPLQRGEFLISKSGGNLIVDGVEIEQLEGGFQAFQANQRYLLLLYLYPTGFAGTVGGPLGVFTIQDNDRIHPVNGGSHPLQKEIIKNNSLELLRLKVKQTR